MTAKHIFYISLSAIPKFRTKVGRLYVKEKLIKFDVTKFFHRAHTVGVIIIMCEYRARCFFVNELN